MSQQPTQPVKQTTQRLETAARLAELDAERKRLRASLAALSDAVRPDWHQRLDAWRRGSGRTMRMLADELGCSWSCVASWHYPWRTNGQQRRPSPALEARLLALGAPHPCGDEAAE